MRYHCFTCGKSVTSELPDDSVIRACLICPQCIGENKIVFPVTQAEIENTVQQHIEIILKFRK